MISLRKLLKGILPLITYLVMFFSGGFLSAEELQWELVNSKYNYELSRNYYCADFKLDPKLYDIYAGLAEGEDRTHRTFLTGWWKLRKIPNTIILEVEKVSNNQKFRTAGREGRYVAGKDIGLKEKFFSPEYDDSEWAQQFVPWDWNSEFIGYIWDGVATWLKTWSKDLIQCPAEVKKMLPADFGKTRNRYRHCGAGWYRREFILPAVESGMRAVLHFEYVGTESTVWINGQEVGSYVVVEQVGLQHRGLGAESHEYDITNAVKFGKENTIVVRVFDHGYPSWVGRPKAGGILLPVWVDLVPPVYADQILITPLVTDGKVDVRILMRNKLSGEQKIRPRIVIKPWRSYRYEPKGKSGIIDTRLTERCIAPGSSEFRTTLTMSNPVTWDFENPFLYHVQIYAAITGWNDNKEVLIGQARFGFRSITTRGADFYLNGKRLFLCGANLNEQFSENLLIAVNYDHWIERWYDKLQYANIRYYRNHSGNCTRAFYDIADEKGQMLSDEFFGPGESFEGISRIAVTKDHVISHIDALNGTEQEREALVDQVRRWAYMTYNNPSLLLHSLGNEHLCWGAAKKEIYARIVPYCRDLYDIRKRFDATRPITDCSGSNCVRRIAAKEVTQWTKADFYDFHDYNGSWSWGSFFHLARNLQIWKQCYRQLDGGVDKPVINGECVWTLHEAFRKKTKRIWGELKATMPNLDRKLYVDTLKKAMKVPGITGQFPVHYVNKVGLRAFLSHPDLGSAQFLKHFTEIFRRMGNDLDGFCLHALGLYFTDSPRVGERKSVPEVLRTTCSPLFVCCNEFDKNVFAGHPIKMKVFAINDSMHNESDVRVTFTIAGKSGNTICSMTRDVGNLSQGTRKISPVSMRMPIDQPTGHYRMLLQMTNANGDVLSKNQYPLYVQGRNVRKIRVSGRVVGYFGNSRLAGQTKKILRSLGIPFTEVSSSFTEIENADVLIIAPDSIDKTLRANSAKLSTWLKNGGRILCLEQSYIGQIPFLPGASLAKAGNPLKVDLIALNHPAFAGLEQRDWQLWNSGKSSWTHKRLCHNFVLPLSESVIASAGNTPAFVEFGMVIAEVKTDKGICLLSQVDAIERFYTDSVANQYVCNLLKYALGDKWTGSYAKPLPYSTVAKWRRPDVKKTFTVDLRPYCNMGFTDQVANDQKGGWIDAGPGRDLCNAPIGLQTFQGVPFDIINPKTNNGVSCIVLRGKSKLYFPESVENIQVNKQHVERLFFLVACDSPGKDGKEIAVLNIRYAPGGLGVTSKHEVRLIIGKNVDHWITPRQLLPEGFLAWQKHHPQLDVPVGLYMVEWKNKIDERITAVDFSVNPKGKAIPILVALSGELK